MIPVMLDTVADLVNADADLVRRGRFLSTTFLVEVGATAYLVHVREGRIARVERGPFLMREWSFALRASEEAWRRFWEPVPAPGYHDFFAMSRAFRALVGLESADYQAPWYDDTSWLHRPDVHGEVCGALMSGLIAPQSPRATRWDTLWMYMQGGPGVFKGDLFFYRADGDFRDRVGRIDTRECPLYLLTGEYDFSCTPEDTKRTAEKIPGAHVTLMKEIGHFPMSENPGRFREYLMPVLEEIRTKHGA